MKLAAKRGLFKKAFLCLGAGIYKQQLKKNREELLGAYHSSF
jgi:hypothetical protein